MLPCPVIAGLFTSGCTTSISRMPISVALGLPAHDVLALQRPR
jgi:hypothetical protein